MFAVLHCVAYAVGNHPQSAEAADVPQCVAYVDGNHPQSAVVAADVPRCVAYADENHPNSESHLNCW